MGKSTISIAIFNSYVSLPEGTVSSSIQIQVMDPEFRFFSGPRSNQKNVCTEQKSSIF